MAPCCPDRPAGQGRQVSSSQVGAIVPTAHEAGGWAPFFKVNSGAISAGAFVNFRKFSGGSTGKKVVKIIGIGSDIGELFLFDDNGKGVFHKLIVVW